MLLSCRSSCSCIASFRRQGIACTVAPSSVGITTVIAATAFPGTGAAAVVATAAFPGAGVAAVVAATAFSSAGVAAVIAAAAFSGAGVATVVAAAFPGNSMYYYGWTREGCQGRTESFKSASSGEAPWGMRVLRWLAERT